MATYKCDNCGLYKVHPSLGVWGLLATLNFFAIPATFIGLGIPVFILGLVGLVGLSFTFLRPKKYHCDHCHKIFSSSEIKNLPKQ